MSDFKGEIFGAYETKKKPSAKRLSKKASRKKKKSVNDKAKNYKYRSDKKQ